MGIHPFTLYLSTPFNLFHTYRLPIPHWHIYLFNILPIGSLSITISHAILLPRTVVSLLIKVLLFIPMAIDWMVDRPGASDGSGEFRDRWEFEGCQSPPLSFKISSFSASSILISILLTINL